MVSQWKEGFHHWWSPWAFLKSEILPSLLIVRYTEGRRCRRGASEAPEFIPNTLEMRLLVEFFVASLSSFPTPNFSIFFLCLKYPIYSEQIGSFGFTKRWGNQLDNTTKGLCSWASLLCCWQPFTARLRPALNTLLVIRIPSFTFSFWLPLWGQKKMVD